jgi:type 1 glutamine amidotransferase
MRVLYLLLCISFICSCKKKEPHHHQVLPKVLLFTKAEGFYHESTTTGLDLFRANATKWGIELDGTDKSNVFTTSNLEQYQLIVLLNNTGNLFTSGEQLALQSFVRKGGSILGIHAAADAEYDWPWYRQMLGGQFKDHPAIQEAKCMVVLPSHPSVKGIPSVWLRTDEWYNFSDLAIDNQVVLTVDESSYIGGSHGDYHPVSWYREFEGARIFYTAMGHSKESYQDTLFIHHISSAIQWLLEP